jgi:hypothetical protein
MNLIWKAENETRRKMNQDPYFGGSLDDASPSTVVSIGIELSITQELSIELITVMNYQ